MPGGFPDDPPVESASANPYRQSVDWQKSLASDTVSAAPIEPTVAEADEDTVPAPQSHNPYAAAAVAAAAAAGVGASGTGTGSETSDGFVVVPPAPGSAPPVPPAAAPPVSPNADPAGALATAVAGKQRSLYVYEATRDEDLPLREGDIITPLSPPDGEPEEGWLYGARALDGASGWFPAAYVTPITGTLPAPIN